jgi:hypothetical protein
MKLITLQEESLWLALFIKQLKDDNVTASIAANYSDYAAEEYRKRMPEEVLQAATTPITPKRNLQ